MKITPKMIKDAAQASNKAQREMVQKANLSVCCHAPQSDQKGCPDFDGDNEIATYHAVCSI